MTRIRAAGAAAILILSISSCAKPEEVKPADAKAYMIEHVQPAAQNYWDAVQYVSDEKGAREIVPTNAEEWNRTVEAARALKQSAEILKQPAYAANRGTDWQDFAEGLAQAAARAETAMKSTCQLPSGWVQTLITAHSSKTGAAPPNNPIYPLRGGGAPVDWGT